MRNNTVSLKMLIVCSFLFCSSWSRLFCPASLEAADVKKLARAGDKTITSQDLDDMMAGLGREMFDEKEDKLNILKELVRIEVFSREARAVGLDDDKILKNEITRFINVFLAKEYIKRNIHEAVTISEEEIKEYHHRHAEEFQTPEKMRVRQIFLSLEPQAAPLEVERKRRQAEDILRLVKEGNDFSNLSVEYSEDTMISDQRGDLGYITRHALSPEYGDAVFALGAGEISPVLRGEFGFSIFKNEDRVPAGTLPLGQVIEEIEKKIRRQKEDEAFYKLEKKLFAKYNVEIWENNLQDDAQPPDDDTVVSSGGDNDVSKAPGAPDLDEGKPVITGLPGYPKAPIGEKETGTPGTQPAQQ